MMIVRFKNLNGDTVTYADIISIEDTGTYNYLLTRKNCTYKISVTYSEMISIEVENQRRNILVEDARCTMENFEINKAYEDLTDDDFYEFGNLLEDEMHSNNGDLEYKVLEKMGLS